MTIAPAAGLLPQGIVQFLDANGAPLAGGSVTFYEPNTTTLATVWGDPNKSVALQNPVPLNAGGWPSTGGAICEIYGDAQYSMLVLDSYGNTVWGPVLTQDCVSLINEITGGAGSVGTVATVAALRALSAATYPGTIVDLLGFSYLEDGGEGLFVVNAGDVTSADNGGTIFVDASGRRWNRQGKTTDFINLSWFNVTGLAPDCSPGLANAIAVALATAGGAELKFAPGLFTFTSTTIVNYPSAQFSLSLTGCGADVSTIYVSSGATFLELNGSSPFHGFHFRDLSFTTSAAGGSTAVQIYNSVQGGNFAQNDFTRCTFRGSDGGGQAAYWQNAISIVGWNNINYDGCLFYGNSTANGSNGLLVAGSAAGSFKYSLIHNLVNCGFFNLGVGLTYGTYVQGVAISNCNFTNGTTDIYIPASAVGAVQLTVSNSQFAGIGNRILIDAGIANIMFHNNLVFVTENQTGILINAYSGQNTFIGNAFVGNGGTTAPVPGTTGIYTLAGGYNNTVIGNSFFTLQTGVNLQGAPLGWNVQANNYLTCTNVVLNIQGNSVGLVTP